MAPNRLPWSVTATAGMPNSTARLARSSVRIIPSSKEYSVWRWRWTNESDIGTSEGNRSTGKGKNRAPFSAMWNPDTPGLSPQLARPVPLFRPYGIAYCTLGTLLMADFDTLGPILIPTEFLGRYRFSDKSPTNRY